MIYLLLMSFLHFSTYVILLHLHLMFYICIIWLVVTCAEIYLIVTGFQHAVTVQRSIIDSD